MAFGTEMRALPADSGPEIILKELAPHTAPELPLIPPGSAIGRQLDWSYLYMLNEIRHPESGVYKDVAVSEDIMAWGIFAEEEAAEHGCVHPIGSVALRDVRTPSHTVFMAIADPDYIRQGIGSRVYPVVAHAARQLGAEQLEVKIRADNLASRSLAEKMGQMMAGVCRIPSEALPYKRYVQYIDPQVLAAETVYAAKMQQAVVRGGPELPAEQIQVARMRTRDMLDLAVAHAGRGEG